MFKFVLLFYEILKLREREGKEGIIIAHWIKKSNYLFYKLVNFIKYSIF